MRAGAYFSANVITAADYAKISSASASVYLLLCILLSGKEYSSNAKSSPQNLSESDKLCLLDCDSYSIDNDNEILIFESERILPVYKCKIMLADQSQSKSQSPPLSLYNTNNNISHHSASTKSSIHSNAATTVPTEIMSNIPLNCIKLYELFNVNYEPEGFKHISLTHFMQHNPYKNDSSLIAHHYRRFIKIPIIQSSKVARKTISNKTINSIEYIMNPALFKKFQLRHSTSVDQSMKWAFHGSAKSKVDSIMQNGFYMPDNEKFRIGAGGNEYGGHGAYFSLQMETSLSYGSVLLVCILLSGREYHIKNYEKFERDKAKWIKKEINERKKIMKFLKGNDEESSENESQHNSDNNGNIHIGYNLRAPGYDSHIIDKGAEIVIFESERILPVYKITFR